MISRIRTLTLSLVLLAPFGAIAAPTQLIGVGATSCKAFEAQAASFKAIRERVHHNRNSIGKLKTLSQEQNQDLSETYRALGHAQDSIDTWFEARFDEYARGVIQSETASLSNRPGYRELMLQLHTHRFVLDFEEFCNKPGTDAEYYYQVIDFLAKDVIRTLNRAGIFRD